MNFPRKEAYHRSMMARTSLRLKMLFVVLGAALGAIGCDTGGLLVVEHDDAGPPKVVGHPASELVSGGTVATNGKYKVVYTVGQPTPNQGVSTGKDQRLNGGLVGAEN